MSSSVALENYGIRTRTGNLIVLSIGDPRSLLVRPLRLSSALRAQVTRLRRPAAPPQRRVALGEAAEAADRPRNLAKVVTVE